VWGHAGRQAVFYFKSHLFKLFSAKKEFGLIQASFCGHNINVEPRLFFPVAAGFSVAEVHQQPREVTRRVIVNSKCRGPLIRPLVERIAGF